MIGSKDAAKTKYIGQVDLYFLLVIVFSVRCMHKRKLCDSLGEYLKQIGQLVQEMQPKPGCIHVVRGPYVEPSFIG